MTRAEYVAKFGEPEGKNTWMLEDRACPHCGYRHGFRVEMACFGSLTDEGSDADGDHEWDGQAPYTCNNCKCGGEWHETEIVGLDTGEAIEVEVSAELEAYHKLHDGLSDMIESGRLSQRDIPEDYEWLVAALIKCAPSNQGKENP